MENKKSFMSATLMCGFLIFAFRFNKHGIEWFWEGSEMIPVFLAACTLLFGWFWFLGERKRH